MTDPLYRTFEGTEPADPAATPDPQRKYRIAVTALVILFAPVSWVLVAAKWLLYGVMALGALALAYEVLLLLLHLTQPRY